MADTRFVATRACEMLFYEIIITTRNVPLEWKRHLYYYRVCACALRYAKLGIYKVGQNICIRNMNNSKRAWCLFVRGFVFFFFLFLVAISTVMDNFQEDSRRDKFSERAALKGTSNRVTASLPPRSLFRVKSVKRSRRP